MDRIVYVTDESLQGKSKLEILCFVCELILLMGSGKEDKICFKRAIQRRRRRFIRKPYSADPEEEDQKLRPVKKTVRAKNCNSCGVSKTTVWRNVADGTTLCNACGIRFRKYKMKCQQCWNIPLKNEMGKNCPMCYCAFIKVQ